MNELRYRVLSECLTMVEASLRRFSKNHALVSARPGYEQAWAEEKAKADELRKMMQEVRYAEDRAGRDAG